MNEALTTESSGQTLSVFGIRHHGPGSARSLVAALQALTPDIVLIEGPPEAKASLISLVASPEMVPPVTLLIYDPANPHFAAYYPFAIFSPEWQALLYATRNNLAARFIDLPQSIHFALDAAELAEIESPTEGAEPPDDANDPTIESEIALRQDPLGALAEAAGYEGGGESWWERMVEQRLTGDPAELFGAVTEAMSVLREHTPPLPNAADQLREDRREAYMRQSIRTAFAEGCKKIAVVCGAWHAPVLAHNELKLRAKADKEILKQLPKPVKVQATWAPWTYERLTFASGYGAGIQSPGWYEHLWTTALVSHQTTRTSETVTRWIIRVAQLLREQDIDASSAHVIETVRLAECLASFRGHALPGLVELNEAAQTVLCFGSNSQMQLIAQKLIVGSVLGSVPPETPATPLQLDIRAHHKRLRLLAQAESKVIDLDLRNSNDLERSRLLHRLTLIDVPWGVRDRGTSGKGTFHEVWRIQWRPEMELALIAAGTWGTTIERAASARCARRATEAQTLPPITQLLADVMLADLPEAAAIVMQRLSDQASTSAAPLELMAALPKLINVARYGDVRKTDSDAINHIIDGILVRVCVGLPGACSSLDDDAASAMYLAIVETNHAIRLLQNVEYEALWRQTLMRVADMETAHGVVVGRCVRLLYDEQTLELDDVNRRMSLGLSKAAEPNHAAAWVDGFLRDSGAMLVHDLALWSVIDTWLTNLTGDHFLAVLPLVRRTFATFTPPDRRALGEVAVRDRSLQSKSANASINETFSSDQAFAVLPTVLMLLGGRLDDAYVEGGD